MASTPSAICQSQDQYAKHLAHWRFVRIMHWRKWARRRRIRWRRQKPFSIALRWHPWPTSTNLFLYMLRANMYRSCCRKWHTSKPHLPSQSISLSSARRSGMTSQLLLFLRLTLVHNTYVMWFTVSVQFRARNTALKYVGATNTIFRSYHTATALTKTAAAIHKPT